MSGGVFWALFKYRYGWLMILLVAGAYVMHRIMSGGATSLVNSPPPPPPAETQAHFVGFVLDDAQMKFWDLELPKHGANYRHTKLVLFTDQTSMACGLGDSATGPFYCPNDERVYIDLGFFVALDSKLGAPGRFARAYVVAHEIGHHVQKVLGQLKPGAKGAASVRTELQADCYAGVWAHSAKARGELDPGDVESALDAASRIGDDVLQRETPGHVRPESFTHGTAAQRRTWIARGFTTGDMKQCDTSSQ